MHNRVISPRVSVIIPAFNAADHLNACLQSMHEQSERAIEILVINDGSTDSTPTIADYWAQRDKRVRVIHQENAGVSAARNRGFNMARGQYIAVQDADDYSHPRRFELQMQFLETHQEIGFAGTFARRMDDRGKALGFIKPPRDTKHIKEIMKSRIAFVHPSLMFRRTLIDDGMRYDAALPSAEDWHMLAKISDRFTGTNLPIPLYFYRSVSGQLTQKFAVQGALRSIWAREQLRRRTKGLSPLVHLSQNPTREEAIRIGLNSKELDQHVLERFEYIMRLNLRSGEHALNRELARTLASYTKQMHREFYAQAVGLIAFYGGRKLFQTVLNKQARKELKQLAWRETRYRGHIIKSNWDFRAWNYTPSTPTRG